MCKYFHFHPEPVSRYLSHVKIKIFLSFICEKLDYRGGERARGMAKNPPGNITFLFSHTSTLDQNKEYSNI